MSNQTNDFIIEKFDGMGTDFRQYWDSENKCFGELIGMIYGKLYTHGIAEEKINDTVNTVVEQLVLYELLEPRLLNFVAEYYGLTERLEELREGRS